jgi:IS30 family transposase
MTRLARGERQEMVAMLSAEGMSTRAIAPIVGVDNKTVHNDLRRVENSTPAPVQGMDGKTYRRPEPTPAETAPPYGAAARRFLYRIFPVFTFWRSL